MIATKAYAAKAASAPLAPFQLERQDVGPNDIQIEIQYCGVCHSDIHQVRDEWGGSKFPMVPGHEIVGKIIKVGDAVTKFKVGETAGIGCFVDSCRHCPSCLAGEEQYCDFGMVGTYNSRYKDGTPTYGGYSDQIVVDENYALHISDKLPLEGVAPLLCAGITTYSPLMTWKIGKGHKIAVVGLGGLGHMAVKFGVALGAEVTVLSTSASKKEDALKLGAHHFVVTKNEDEVKEVANTFDFILNTISAQHEYDFYLQMLKLDGTMVLVGIPPEAPQVSAFNLIGKRRRLAGSMIGGIKETQEMLDYCAENGIVSDVEVINIDYINEAYERMLKNDVRYRFVIDMSSLK
ncbi:NAD(P)-dependent alcohol dehydrogenase [Mucilaginibacter roseus]|uniref:NAD(P)-dependent alcohol dehydrogenase n=1 Tax=Mucilaginibacter roseus TaxID=1528868 RepID=A0ABS8U7G3_9SPHI|nr:NAD(P)-dependent alcohol dehydrogenase [Mucilaginibacter roseus]MCD8741854.1 NAD(P)-dependent alcohol dehydrogenase [Mucilaginibacter roseus]